MNNINGRTTVFSMEEKQSKEELRHQRKCTSRVRRQPWTNGLRHAQYHRTIMQELTRRHPKFPSLPPPIVLLIIAYVENFNHDSLVKRDLRRLEDVQSYKLITNFKIEIRRLDHPMNLRMCRDHWQPFMVAMYRGRLRKANRLSDVCRGQDHNCDVSHGWEHMQCEANVHPGDKRCQIILKTSDVMKDRRKGYSNRSVYCHLHRGAEDEEHRNWSVVTWHKHKLYKP